jgi:hypothetical protein
VVQQWSTDKNGPLKEKNISELKAVVQWFTEMRGRQTSAYAKAPADKFFPYNYEAPNLTEQQTQSP